MKALILYAAFAAAWAYASPWTQKKWLSFSVGCALLFISAALAVVQIIGSAGPH